MGSHVAPSRLTVESSGRKTLKEKGDFVKEKVRRSPN